MNVTDYPVTTPYGWVEGYPLNLDPNDPSRGFHRGIDYGCPLGTPVVVNGEVIALSGNTGYSDGPHCHIGRFVNSLATDPGKGVGLSLDAPYVYNTGFDAVNGNWVQLMDAKGVLWVYLHLSEIKVAKGQRIGGIVDSDGKVTDSGARKLLTLSTLLAQGGLTPDRQPTKAEVENLIGRTLESAVDSLTNSSPWGGNWNKVKHYDEDIAAAAQASVEPYTGPQLFTKKS